ncbi:OLC1v1003863C1 [Oldenlandia corymbosa var. corymbosa]|uniref:OLC1v1003863C1 n=1 Tax=Oldenlandia corymbosa var. corymbosa TaxID=529605 RepID=A0AAV1DAY8_OLDCO|nr:OLC1v1003863C1 [Oldenlandia corymbosa var. corymbosa]
MTPSSEPISEPPEVLHLRVPDHPRQMTVVHPGLSRVTAKLNPRTRARHLVTTDKHEDGGDPSEGDGFYHHNCESVVALSTGWFSDGSRWGKMIRITAGNGRSTTAIVVDECDSMHGCNEEHAFQPPCDNYIVDASEAVWNALGLDEHEGRVQITWSVV